MSCIVCFAVMAAALAMEASAFNWSVSISASGSGSSVTLTARVSGDQAAAAGLNSPTYRWSNGSTGSSTTVTSNGYYSVTATSTYKSNPSLSESRTASYYVSTIITGYNWYLYESSNPSGWAQSKLISVVVAGPDGGGASSFMASSGWSGGGSSGSGLSFTATANGSYTVWARDILGKYDSISVTVSGIDRDSPIINTPSVSVSGSTATVTATISDSASGVAVKKWASGSQSESYFASSGTSFSGSSFTVTANGTYTIYAKDNAGNTAVRQVSVSEIGAADPYAAMGWTYMFADSNEYRRISSGYKHFNRPDHYGIDIIGETLGGSAGIYGVEVKAVFGGTIATIHDDHYLMGHAVILKTNSIDPSTGKEIVVRYCHLRDVPTFVKDEEVNKGQKVGNVGNTGYVISGQTGPYAGAHLHFDVIKTGEVSSTSANTVNPQRFFPSINFTGQVSTVN